MIFAIRSRLLLDYWEISEKGTGTMKEIRIHARAGQGAITAALLLASAAFLEGKYSLAFPHFGAERTGAPMNAYARISDAPIRLRTQVRRPDYVLVQDPTLIASQDVAEG